MKIRQELFSFNGRMTRSDYLCKGVLVLLSFNILNTILYFVPTSDARVIYFIMMVVALLPALALMVKQLHDYNRSEVWFLQGTVGPNYYGPPEKPLTVTIQRRSLPLKGGHTMRDSFLLFLIIIFCVYIPTTYAQKHPVKSGTVPTVRLKIDSTRIRQCQRILEDVCVQYGIIKRNLPAATQQKAVPAIKTVRDFWRSHPGNADVLNLAGSEIRRIFGSRPKNVENVLMCYVFGEVLQCLVNTMEAERYTRQEAAYMFENFDQKVNQLFTLLSTIVEDAKKMDAAITRSITP